MKPSGWVSPVESLRRAEPALRWPRQLSAARTPVDKTAIQRQIEAADRQLDRLVYEFYGLTDEQVAIVEAATGSRGGRGQGSGVGAQSG